MCVSRRGTPAHRSEAPLARTPSLLFIHSLNVLWPSFVKSASLNAHTASGSSSSAPYQQPQASGLGQLIGVSQSWHLQALSKISLTVRGAVGRRVLPQTLERCVYGISCARNLASLVPLKFYPNDSGRLQPSDVRAGCFACRCLSKSAIGFRLQPR